jgi:uncharacterized protein Veg
MQKATIFFQSGNTYTMIKPKKTIEEVKQMVKACHKSRVRVQVDLGRNKRMQFSGVLSGLYPALFTVAPDEENFLGKTAYSYSDVLCGTVKLKKLP